MGKSTGGKFFLEVEKYKITNELISFSSKSLFNVIDSKEYGTKALETNKELANIPYIENEHCPNCGKEIQYCDKEYRVNKERYPKYCNESQGGNSFGNYYDWVEIHCCKKCKKLYCLDNGAY